MSIVVFTLASGQFSPRVLRTFLRDRWSQSTLAAFVATWWRRAWLWRRTCGPFADVGQPRL